jgi:hypothetical protein
MIALIQLLTLPIMLLNLFGGIVGAVWLLFLGQWQLFVYGLLLGIFPTFLVFIPMLPGVLLTGAAAWAVESKQYLLGWLSAALGSVWIFAVVTCWCVFVFLSFTSVRHYGQPALPFLLSAYAIATAPWTYMASKERAAESSATTIATLATCVGCALLIIEGLFLARLTIPSILEVFLVPIVVAFVLQLALFGAIANAHHRQL